MRIQQYLVSNQKGSAIRSHARFVSKPMAAAKTAFFNGCIKRQTVAFLSIASRKSVTFHVPPGVACFQRKPTFALEMKTIPFGTVLFKARKKAARLFGWENDNSDLAVRPHEKITRPRWPRPNRDNGGRAFSSPLSMWPQFRG